MISLFTRSEFDFLRILDFSGTHKKWATFKKKWTFYLNVFFNHTCITFVIKDLHLFLC